jgi:hypothetical protein
MGKSIKKRPESRFFIDSVAEREGFEPSMQF